MKRLSIDDTRFIAALLVVAIHTYPLLDINSNLDFLFTHVFCRIAVPFFLMITGFFLIPKALSDKNILVKYSQKIVKIYLVTILLYLPINIYTGYFRKMSILGFIKDLCIDGTFYHLWYFPALLSGIWLSYYFLKCLPTKKVLIIVSLLYLIGLLGDSYYGVIKNYDLAMSIYNGIFQISTYTRNGIFYVPIFICMGYLFTKLKKKPNFKRDILLFLISLLAMEIEGFILHTLKLQRHDSMYLFLIPTMFFLFQFRLYLKGASNKRIRTIATIVYIIHPFMIIIVRALAKIFHLERFLIENNLIHYVGVIVLSILFSALFEKGKRRVKNAIIKRKNNPAPTSESVDRN